MLPAPPSCCALMNFICGRLAMASPIANEVCARTPKIFCTPLELKYSTRTSATFVSAIFCLRNSLIGLISAGAGKMQLGMIANRHLSLLSRFLWRFCEKLPARPAPRLSLGLPDHKKSSGEGRLKLNCWLRGRIGDNACVAKVEHVATCKLTHLETGMPCYKSLSVIRPRSKRIRHWLNGVYNGM